MEKCKTIEEGVRNTLNHLRITETAQWEYRPAGEGDMTDTLILDGVSYPLFWWRADPQVNALAGLAPARQICSMKLNRTTQKSEGLNKLLYRELDIAEFVMHSRIKSMMNFRNGNSMNMLCTMENEQVALFELAATLHEDSSEQGRHTYWGKNGMASDRVVSQKLPSEALYLFTDDQADPTLYNDLFLHMYGLGRTDVLKAATITEILMGKHNIEDWKVRDAHYRQCICLAEESAQKVCRLAVEEG